MGAVESCAAPARGVQHIEKRALHCPSGVTCGLRGQATPVGGTNTGEREGARAGLRRVVLGECARQTSRGKVGGSKRNRAGRSDQRAIRDLSRSGASDDIMREGWSRKVLRALCRRAFESARPCISGR